MRDRCSSIHVAQYTQYRLKIQRMYYRGEIIYYRGEKRRYAIARVVRRSKVLRHIGYLFGSKFVEILRSSTIGNSIGIRRMLVKSNQRTRWIPVRSSIREDVSIIPP